MSVDTNNTELKKGADLATIADQRDDQRQQAEAEAAQEVLQRMQNTAAEAEKRRAHEEAEAKRKAEWEQKQREKAEAEQAAWENAVAMGDDEVMMASMKRVGDDAERLTRRNMKQCVTEHIVECSFEPTCIFRRHILSAIALRMPNRMWRLSLAICSHIALADVKPQSAMIPCTLGGSCSPAAISTVVAPMETPAR